MNTYKEVTNMILNADWGSIDERERIIKKFFTGRPTIAKFLQRKFDFGSKEIVDIGCSYGQTLFYWGNGSVGIDISEDMASLPRSLGYEVFFTNIEDRLAPGEWADRFDGVYTNNLVEHVLAPHLFLLRIHKILKPDGLKK